MNPLFPRLVFSSVSSPKILEGSNILTLRKQQYFVWDTASQSTKRQDLLELWGAMALFPPPGYACSSGACMCGIDERKVAVVKTKFPVSCSN